MFGRKELERRINELNDRLIRQQKIIEELLREEVRMEDVERIVSRAVLSEKIRSRKEQQIMLPEFGRISNPIKKENDKEWVSIVEEAGLVIDRHKKRENSFAAFSAANTIYNKFGAEHLRTVLHVIKESFGFNKTTTKSEFIKNVSRFIINHRGNRNYDENVLISALKAVDEKTIEEHFYLDGTNEGRKSYISCTNFIRREYNKVRNTANERIL